MWPEWTVNLLSPWQWALFAAAPAAIVALYFLKLKRQPLQVPSTYLWRKSIEDLHVNSLWQRMRQSLLLFLQLLLIALLALALFRPSWQSRQAAGDRLIFLVDNSASMNTSDVQPTRLELAKQRIGEIIDAMESGSAMIISFSDSARIEQGFTENRRELRRALAAIAPTNRSTNLLEALRVAAGRSVSVQLPALKAPKEDNGEPQGNMASDQTIDAIPAKLYIFSDGKFPDVQNFSLGSLEPIFVRMGEPTTANLAITAFSTRRNEERPERLQAFARLENNGDQPIKAMAALYVDDQLRDSKSVDLPAGGNKGVSFDLDDSLAPALSQGEREIDMAVLHLKLTPTDLFPLDNDAWTVINPHRRAKVLFVSPGNPLWERALATTRAGELAEVSIAKPEVLKTPEHQKRVAGGAFDLIIYDACRPVAMPQANTLFIGGIPPAEGWKAGDKVVHPQIIDVAHAHPLMGLVELGDVDVAEGFSVTGPPGSTRLIDSSRGPLLVIGPREGFEDAALGFDFFATNDQGETTLNTNWQLRLSFPLFVHNVLEYLGGEREAALVGSARPGVPVVLRSRGAAERLTVRPPKGPPIDVQRGKLNTFQFNDTEQLGVYQVEQAGKTIQRFAVNLFDPAESDVRARPDNTIKIGYEEVSGREGFQPVRRELWKWLVLAGLGVLMFEWYIYNRRVYL